MKDSTDSVSYSRRRLYLIMSCILLVFDLYGKNLPNVGAGLQSAAK